MGEILLKVENLKMVFQNKKSSFAAVEDLSFSLEEGKTLGIVGESGSGKTMASLSVMRLLPNQGRVAAGTILFQGKDLLKLEEKEMQALRGNDISMIFQDPVMSLDQVYTVGDQIIEAVLTHQKLSKEEAKKKALTLLQDVGISQPERVYRSYPFELSGGMCQRVMIAIALSCNPKLLFADEPTTALDVTVQAQIMELLRDIQRKYNMGIVLITHDLGVVSDAADDIVVMYAGKAMEIASREVIFDSPAHPYTRGLIRSIPRLDTKEERLYSIPGTVPDIRNFPVGCRFCTRCSIADQICREQEPPFTQLSKRHFVRCHKAAENMKIAEQTGNTENTEKTGNTENTENPENTGSVKGEFVHG